MIVTDLDNIEHQVLITPALRKGVDFLRTDILDLPDGRVDIDGDRVFAIVQRYETLRNNDPRLEYHRKYIDIQYIVSGREVIGWAPVGRMAVSEPYDEGKDIAFGVVQTGEMTPVYLQEGQLAVLYPEDGHAPKLAAGEPSSVFKIVVKVAVS